MALTLENGIQQMPVRITVNGNVHFYGGIPGHILIYDKEEQIVVSLRRASLIDAQIGATRKNNGVGHGELGDYEVVWFRFSNIITIGRNINYEEIQDLMGKYVTRGIISEQDKIDLKNRLRM